MQKRYRIACGVAGAAAVLLAALRLVGGGAYTAALCAAVILAAAVVLLCGAKPKPLLVVAGTHARLLGVVTVLAGGLITIASAGDVLHLLKGIYPYPQPVVTAALNSVILWAGELSGIGGGVMLVVCGVHWFSDDRTDRGRFGMAALLPVVWLWGRLVWYMTSFASAVNRFSSLAEAALLLLEMLFLLMFARYISGVEEKAPRFVVPLSLCTAMVGLSVWAVRAIAVLTKNGELYAETELIIFPDFGLLLLAAVFAFLQMFGVAAETYVPSSDDDEDESNARFVLNEDDLAPVDDEEDPEDQRASMELEAILNEFMEQREEKN